MRELDGKGRGLARRQRGRRQRRTLENAGGFNQGGVDFFRLALQPVTVKRGEGCRCLGTRLAEMAGGFKKMADDCIARRESGDSLADGFVSGSKRLRGLRGKLGRRRQRAQRGGQIVEDRAFRPRFTNRDQQMQRPARPGGFAPVPHTL